MLLRDSPVSADLCALAPALRRYVQRRVNRDDVDDVVQEVWVRAHRGAASVHDHGALAPWLFRIARNVVTDHYRARAGEPALQRPGLCTDTAAREEDQNERNQLLREDLLRCMHVFLSELSPEDREVIEATHLTGATQSDLARCLGLSASGAKSKVQRARHKLRAAFESCCVLEFDSRGNVVECRERGLQHAAPRPE